MYAFEYLALKEYFLYKDETIPLDQQGPVFIRGENGAGKSLLFSGLPLMLQGIIGENKIPAKRLKELDLTTSCDIDGVRYVLGMHKNKYTLHENAEPIVKHRKPDAVKQVQALFPEEALFNSTSLVSQWSPIYNNLIAGTPALRMGIIESFVDRAKVEEAKVKLAELKKKSSASSDELISIETGIDWLKKDIPKIKSTKSLAAKVKRLKTQVERKRKELTSATVDHEKWGEQKRLKKKLKCKMSLREMRKDMARIQATKERQEAQFDFLIDPDFELWVQLKKPKLYAYSIPVPTPKVKFKYVTEKQAKKLHDSYNELEHKKSALKDTLKKVKKLEGKKNCPICSHALSEKDIVRIINATEKEIRDIWVKIKALYRKIYCVNVISKLHQSLSGTEYKEVNANADPDDLEEQIEIQEKRITFYEKQIALSQTLAEMKQVSKPKVKLKVLTNELSRLEKTYFKEHNKLVEIKTANETAIAAKEQLRVLNKKKRKLLKSTEDMNMLNPLLKIFGSKEFRTEIVRGFAETLVDEWNRWAPEVFSKRVYFTMDIESGFPAFYFSYNKHSKGEDIKYTSGGERKRLICCMIPSILKVSPSKTNILIVDELDANLDAKGIGAITEFLPLLLSEEFGKTSLFFITPRKNIEDGKYSEWYIERSGDRSTVRRS